MLLCGYGTYDLWSPRNPVQRCTEMRAWLGLACTCPGTVLPFETLSGRVEVVHSRTRCRTCPMCFSDRRKRSLNKERETCRNLQQGTTSFSVKGSRTYETAQGLEIIQLPPEARIGVDDVPARASLIAVLGSHMLSYYFVLGYASIQAQRAGIIGFIVDTRATCSSNACTKAC